MPKDRLAEFEAKRDGVEEKEGAFVRGDAMNMSMTLPGLFEKINALDGKLTELRTETEEVRKIQKNVNSSPFVEPKEIRKMEKFGGNYCAPFNSAP